MSKIQDQKSKKIKFIELDTIYIPDHWMQRKYKYLKDFLNHYPIDKKHTFYYKHQNTIFAFYYDDRMVDFYDLKDNEMEIINKNK